jgi:hypothetical protein
MVVESEPQSESSEPAELPWDSEPSITIEPVVPDDTAPAPETASEPEQGPPPRTDQRFSYPTSPSRSSGRVLLALFILLLLAAVGVVAFKWLQADLEHMSGPGDQTGQGSS